MKRKIPKNKRYKPKEKNYDVEKAEEFIKMHRIQWTTTPTGRLIVYSENNR